ncbi:MAG: hypothetical protein ACR2NZ_00310 [Rubripirellula sp.]
MKAGWPGLRVTISEQIAAGDVETPRTFYNDSEISYRRASRRDCHNRHDLILSAAWAAFFAASGEIEAERKYD